MNPSIKLQTLDGSSDTNYTLPFDRMTEGTKSVDATNKTIYFDDFVNLDTTTHYYYKYAGQMSTEFGDTIDITKLNETSCVLFTATYKDTSGNISNISKEIYVNVGWTANLTMGIDQRVTKYVSSNSSAGKFVTLETTVVSKLNSSGKRNILPVKQSKLVIDVPTYQGIEPSKINVSAKKTIATNGKDETNVVFDDTNWSYDSTQKQITITVNNTLDGNIATSKRGADEFVISYTYPEAAYDLIDLTGVNIKNKVSGTFTLYSNSSTADVQNSINDTLTLKEYIGTESGTIPKSYLYVNTFGETLYELRYTSRINLYMEEIGTIASEKYILNSANITDGTTTYPTYISGVNYLPVVKFIVPVTEFTSLLGSSGTIKISDQNDNLLNTMSSSTTTETINGVVYYSIEIPEETARGVENYHIVTSAPIANLTTMNFLYYRKIQTDLPYTIKQLQSFKQVDEVINVYSSYNSAPTNYEFKQDLNITVTMTDTDTNASLSVESSTIKNTSEAQKMILNIALDNTRKDTDLWENPVFDIELPEYITSIDNPISIQIKNISNFSVVEDELKVVKRDGKLHLIVRLSGTQKSLYDDAAVLHLEFNVHVDKYIPSISKDINLLYFNNLAHEYRNPSTFVLDPTNPTCGIATTSVDFVTDATLLCVSEISNFNDAGDTIDSFDADTTGTISIDGVEPTMSLIIQNNHTVPVSNVKVLGRIPYINNKSVIADKDLGTEISTVLTSVITKVSTIDDTNYTIYYSEKLNASNDLTDTANNWVTTPTDLSKVKSFMIVLNNYELAVGEQLKFQYTFKTDTDLKFDKSLFANFGSYYSYNGIASSSEANKIGLTTGNGPTLRVEKTSSIPAGTTVKEGDTITYTITVYNDGDVDANNIVIKDQIPENTTYLKEENGNYVEDASITTITSDTKDTLAAGENLSISFTVKVNDFEGDAATIKNTAIVSAKGLDDISSNSLEINAIPAEAKLRVEKTSNIPDGTSVQEGDIITYTITVYNDGNAPAKNVVITDEIPQYTTYAKEDNGNYVKDASITSINFEALETLEPGQSVSITFTVIVNEIEKHDAYINNTAVVKADGLEASSSNTIKIPTIPTEKKPSLRAVKTSSIQDGTSVKEGDLITYKITVYNDGNGPAYNVVIHDVVPENTIYVELDTTTNQYVEKPSVTTLTSSTTGILAAGEKCEMSFTVKVKEITTANVKITNTASVTADDLDEITSNTISISTTPIIKAPALRVVKSSSINTGTSVKEGDIITYTLTVTNNGEGNARNVVLHDTIPDYTTCVEKDANGQYVKKTSITTITSDPKEILAPGESYSISFSVMVNKITDENVIITNTAKVTADNSDDVSSNTVGITAEKSQETPVLPDTGNHVIVILLVSISVIGLTACIITYFQFKKLANKRE